MGYFEYVVLCKQKINFRKLIILKTLAKSMKITTQFSLSAMLYIKFITFEITSEEIIFFSTPKCELFIAPCL